jgi:hypothetical protein
LLSSLNTKLVRFLRDHPDYFEVGGQDEDQDSSIVPSVKLVYTKSNEFKRTEMSTDHDDVLICAAAKELYRRTEYELQKRISKLQRRRKRRGGRTQIRTQTQKSSKSENEGRKNTESELDLDHVHEPGADLNWLCRKVEHELHSYIRLCNEIRPMRLLTFSEEWHVIASSLYLNFLKSVQDRKCAYLLDYDSSVNIGIKLSAIQMDTPNMVHDSNLDSTLILVHLIKPIIQNGANVEAEERALLEKISARVKRILRDKSPLIGGLEFGKLLQDYDLRSLTGGKDLKSLMEDAPDFFNGVELFIDEKRSVAGDDDNNGRTHGREQNNCHYIKLAGGFSASKETVSRSSTLLLADEVGTYSLTRPRIAIAMAKLLFNACKYGHLGPNPNFSMSRNDKLEFIKNHTHNRLSLGECYTCIDLTAGVGGNAIAFCKTFDQVYAYEIDLQRSKILEKNLDSHLLPEEREKIFVECRDSVEALEKVSRQFRQYEQKEGKGKVHVAVFIDPPFGGIHYRSDNENGFKGLNLGINMPLELVLSKIADHLSNVTVGLKLPLQFKVAPFVESVKFKYFETHKESLDIKVHIIKKMERQLFVIVYMQPKNK